MFSLFAFPASSPVAAWGFPDAKVGCRARSSGLKCIPGQILPSAKRNWAGKAVG